MLEAANISAISLAAVLILVAIRQVVGFKLEIWKIMLLGAMAVVLTGQISPGEAAGAVNLDVMIFLAGMFVIGESMQESGYLLHLSYCVFRRARNLDQLLLLILFGAGLLSALLMNDTLAIIGTPLMLYFARTQSISPKLLLLDSSDSIRLPLSWAFARASSSSGTASVFNLRNSLITDCTTFAAEARDVPA